MTFDRYCLLLKMYAVSICTRKAPGDKSCSDSRSRNSSGNGSIEAELRVDVLHDDWLKFRSQLRAFIIRPHSSLLLLLYLGVGVVHFCIRIDNLVISHLHLPVSFFCFSPLGFVVAKYRECKQTLAMSRTFLFGPASVRKIPVIWRSL